MAYNLQFTGEHEITHVNMAGFGSVMLGADFLCLAPAVDLGVVLAAPWVNFLGIVAAFWEGAGRISCTKQNGY